MHTESAMDNLLALETVPDDQCRNHANLYLFCQEAPWYPYMTALNLLDLDARQAPQDLPWESLCAAVEEYYYWFNKKTHDYNKEGWDRMQQEQNHKDLSRDHVPVTS